MVKTYEESYAVGDGHGVGIVQWGDYESAALSVSGSVATQYGFVLVDSRHDNESGEGRSSMRMIAGDRQYVRTMDRFFTKRGLVTKAKQFAKELHEGKVQS